MDNKSLCIDFILNNNKRDPFASFHIRQAIGLGLFSLINIAVLSRFMGDWATWIINVGIIVLTVFGALAALQGEKKKIPLFGDLFQDWFRNI